MKLRLLALAALLLSPLLALAQSPDRPAPTEKRVYKQIGDTSLELWIWKPADWKPTDRRNAIVFYHGGGWRNGSPAAFSRQSAKLAERGMVALSVQYRLTAQPGITIADCVKDARSAFRWVRAHAAELGIDPGKIAAGGGSAGGHLAAALATLDHVNDDSDDTKISTQPAALVLFNPALKLAGMRAEPIRSGPSAETVRTVDPYEHAKRGHPPTIIFHGEADTTVPIATARAYAEKIRSLGAECEVIGFDDQPHSFFNREPFVWDTLKQTESFLEKHALLSRSSSTAAATAPTSAAPSSSQTPTQLASARLLGVRRITPPKNENDASAPRDGLAFAVVVSPTTELTSGRALKEMKDALRIGGKSYADLSQTALGKKYSPKIVVHDADKFFADTPALSRGEAAPPPGSYVLTMSYIGAELETNAPVELIVEAGYNKQADTFRLRTRVPPGR